MKLLIYNPDNRITASQALKHAYFNEERAKDTKQNFSITQPVMYSQGTSDKDDDKTSQMNDGHSNQGTNSIRMIPKGGKNKSNEHNDS
jgi:serine/threonine protein kinase